MGNKPTLRYDNGWGDELSVVVVVIRLQSERNNCTEVASACETSECSRASLNDVCRISCPPAALAEMSSQHSAASSVPPYVSRNTASSLLKVPLSPECMGVDCRAVVMNGNSDRL